MLIGPQNLADNFAQVRSHIASAAAAAGRSEHSITLVAVTKAQPLEIVRAAVRLGHRDFGENYPQEAAAKIDALEKEPDLSAAGPTGKPEWHFIGHLQSNKARLVAQRFQWVHAVDRTAIARRLSEQRGFHQPPLNVLLQVKLADEATKSGVAPQDAETLAREVASLPRLKLRGLMCLPPASEDPERQRPYFRHLRDILDRLNAAGFALDCLSMGMSADYEVAINEGATHVRVGTALFGPRQP